MKKKILIVLLTLMLPITAYGAYVFNDANLTLNVNGAKVDCKPMSYNGTTYLPLRTVAETLGAKVDYNGTTKQIDVNTLDVNKLAESCVMLFSEDSTNGMQGSGIYVDYGKILTCDHVTKGKTKHYTSDKLNLTLDKSNTTLDASILTSPNTSIKPVKIGDSDEVKRNDKVVLITSPERNKNKVTYGMVTGITSNGDAVDIAMKSLDGGKLIDNGSSGGAVFNMQGELIGIAKWDDGTLTYATGINQIRKEL